MFNWFRSSSPYTLLLLLLYAMVLKSYYLLYPAGAALHGSDGVLYRWLVGVLGKSWGEGSVGFTALAQLLLFLQALTVNNLVNRYRLFPKATYFPAMCYLLFTSFFREWNYFSAALLAGTGMIWIFSEMVALYAANEARRKVFNTGFIIGVLTMIYMPALASLLLLWIALLINRPFKPAEWILAIVGILCPFYFLATILFLTNHSLNIFRVPEQVFDLPRLQGDYIRLAVTAGIVLIAFCGFIMLQRHFFNLLIQIRKIWNLLYVYLLLALLLPFLSGHFTYHGWIIAMAPLVVLQAQACWNMHNKLFANIVHTLVLAAALALQYRPL